MSEWKASPSDLKRLHTDSNLKTNTSFEFAQNSHLEFASHLPNLPSQLEEELPSSNVYFGEGNHSTISLQPTVTPTAVAQFMAVVEMVRFLGIQTEERRRRIEGKRGALLRLERAVAEQEWRVKVSLEHFSRRREVLDGKKGRLDGFKKRKLRAVTEETEKVELQVNCLLRGLKGRNASRSFIDRRQVQEESIPHEPPRRKKIYVPLAMPQPQYHYYPPINAHYPPYLPPHPPAFVHSQTQVPVWAPSPNQDPSRRSSLNYPSHKLAQQDLTVQKQPILLQQLRDALTMKFKEVQEADLDYFDSPSRSRQGEDRKSETPKSAIRRSSSIKWRRDDMEDKELVEIIEKSIKHIKTEHTDEQNPKDTSKQPQNNPQEEQRVSPARPQRNNNSDSSSIINITYDSEDKRNSKSFERDGESRVGKASSRASEKKSERGRQIEQSNVKIEMVDMSNSKNSNSSQSDSSKQPHTRYLPSLAHPFQEIQEESEEMASLKVTPSENHGSRNAKRQESPKQALAARALAEEEEDDDILKSIKLDTESRISRNLYLQNSQLPPEDDILDGITLLKESRASREKALSLKSSALVQDFQQLDPKREKGSQSQIFAKEDVELGGEFDFDQTLRLSTKSKINKPGKSIIRTNTERIEVSRRGQTEPIKPQQLTSIPSAEYESEEDDTPPTSRARIKQSPVPPPRMQ